jgi:hypothetical protein
LTIALRWAGDGVSRHGITRPVGSYERLGDFPLLLARIRELRAAGHRSAEIAATLNAEGFRSPRGDQRFTADRVRRVSSRRGLRERHARGLADGILLGPDEVWMTDLADELGVPTPTLMAWCHKGWVHARKVPAPEPRWLVWADGTEKDRLRRLGEGRRRGLSHPYPAELTTPGKPRSARE